MTFVFGFDHDHEVAPRTLAGLLGGKGANLAEMRTVLGLPVPPGFTISTEACRAYLADGAWPAGLEAEVASALGALEAEMGRRLGAPGDPLLLSVRSGAARSMPGMMDTILNLGCTTAATEGLAALTGNEAFALDARRRFVQLYGSVVLGVAGDAFEAVLTRVRAAAGVETDAQLEVGAWREVVAAFEELVERDGADVLPDDPAAQLRGAIEAVFRSWQSPRALAYRRREGIASDLGTAVNVQAMVFGNRDARSGTGVGFTRDPATGEPQPYGDFLERAQGEDVVAGVRVTQPLDAMASMFPDAHSELLGHFATLERHYRDMMDVEFTIEQDRLWVLQTRVGKRSGAAAIRIAVDMVVDPAVELTRAEAVARVEADDVEAVLHPRLSAGDLPVVAEGLPASPGAGVGAAYFDADGAVAAVDRGEAVVLVRQETSPEDVHGMVAAEAILTSRGGLVSHAAVVARGWGKPAVVGAGGLEVGRDSARCADGTVIAEGEVITVDGDTGRVFAGAATLEAGEPPPELATLLGWADDIREGHLGVRANADTGPDATRARALGAEGLGLARTEHMFLGDRLPVVRRVILAESEADEAAALAELLEVQRADFAELLEAMDGLPVTVRLLDPPLHEFLPSLDELHEARARGELDAAGRAQLTAAERWHEQNPMLDIRGTRLGFVRPGLYRMQVRALLEAVVARREAGGDPQVEVMLPLISLSDELRTARRWVEEQVAETLGEAAAGSVRIGTMIETPRAALRAGALAESAEFFSFGTNDLTQLTFGFSRDDVGELIGGYLRDGVLRTDPFETVDALGVGELVQMGIERGRATRPGLTCGVCGEHGGDPASIAVFAGLGVDYVSCSPFRVPVARLAAAQAVLAATD